MLNNTLNHRRYSARGWLNEFAYSLASYSAVEFPRKFGKMERMKSKFTYWTEPDGKFLGYLNDYPDHWTQGDSIADLKEHLLDLHQEFKMGDLPGIKKVEEIEVG